MDSCPMIPTIFRFTVLRSLRLRSLAIQTWGSNRPEKNVAIVEFCDCFGVAFWLGMFWGKGSSSIPWYDGIHPWPCRVSPASQFGIREGIMVNPMIHPTSQDRLASYPLWIPCFDIGLIKKKNNKKWDVHHWMVVSLKCFVFFRAH